MYFFREPINIGPFHIQIRCLIAKIMPGYETPYDMTWLKQAQN
jgi:hypothetical protein